MLEKENDFHMEKKGKAFAVTQIKVSLTMT